MQSLSLDTLLKIPPAQKFAFLAVLIAVLAGGYYFTLYVPAQEKLAAMNAELTKLQAQHAEQQKILADLPKFRQELKELQVQFDESLKLLPNTREIPSLLTNISKLAQESGLKILLFQPKPELNKGFYAEIPVEMKVEGKYHDFGYFCDRISKLERIVNVNNMQLTAPKQKKDSGGYPANLEASFSAVTFKFIKQEEQAPAKKPRGKR